jgi:hypothetical protein
MFQRSSSLTDINKTLLIERMIDKPKIIVKKRVSLQVSHIPLVIKILQQQQKIIQHFYLKILGLILELMKFNIRSMFPVQIIFL